MKKRGIKPTTRTWSTLLTYFPKSLDQSAEKVLSRYTIIYDEAQSKIQGKLQTEISDENEREEDLQVVADPDRPPAVNRGRSDGELRNEPDAFEEPQIVSNQYMQILAHFGKLDEMLRVLRMMPTSGPGAPDAVTFGVVLKALLDRNKVLKAARRAQSKVETRDSLIGRDESGMSHARAVWDQLVRQHQGLTQSKGDLRTVLDEQNAVLGIRALSEGSKEDAALALTLLTDLYGLSRPGESAMARAEQKDITALSTLQLDDRSAETILNLCLGTKRNLDAAHFAKQFLDRPDVLSGFRQRQWQLMMAAFANAHDCHMCQRLIETFGPKGEQRRWSYQTYAYLFRSARWTKDMERFLDLMEDYAILPEAYIADNVRGREPNQHRDLVAKRELLKTRAPREVHHQVSPTLEMATLMLETAIDGQRLSSMRQALRVSEVLKEGALILAQQTQMVDEELAIHATARAKDGRAAPGDLDDVKPRNPEKVGKRVNFWRRRRYERLGQILDAVLDAGHMAEAGTSPQEQAKWEKMARLVKEKLNPDSREFERNETEGRAPPRNVKEWKNNLQSAQRSGPYMRREPSRPDDSFQRDGRPEPHTKREQPRWDTASQRNERSANRGPRRDDSFQRDDRFTERVPWGDRRQGFNYGRRDDSR